MNHRCCVYNKLCDSFSKTVSEFIINDVIPFMAFCAEIWQQKGCDFHWKSQPSACILMTHILFVIGK